MNTTVRSRLNGLLQYFHQRFPLLKHGLMAQYFLKHYWAKALTCHYESRTATSKLVAVFFKSFRRKRGIVLSDPAVVYINYGRLAFLPLSVRIMISLSCTINPKEVRLFRCDKRSGVAIPNSEERFSIDIGGVPLIYFRLISWIFLCTSLAVITNTFWQIK